MILISMELIPNSVTSLVIQLDPPSKHGNLPPISSHLTCLKFKIPFISRKDCSSAGVHTQNYAGIAGSTINGAYSVCMSGGYEDDQDHGETLYVYIIKT